MVDGPVVFVFGVSMSSAVGLVCNIVGVLGRDGEVPGLGHYHPVLDGRFMGFVCTNSTL